jgi:two-component system phosphate regulon sensor histidine kinase PhoR
MPGDRAQLEQLVRNLIDNALKYGGVEEPVDVGLSGGDDGIVLTVRDHGPGIAPEHLPHLTRRFYRADPGRSRASGGTGLGLAIVKHIVERHRGRLDIASTLGQGTTVTAVFRPVGRVS